MDEQEVVKQIRELQKKRTSLKEQDTVLVLKIMELRDKLRGGSIKEGYYTNSQGLFCKVCNIEGGNIHVYELNTTDLPSLIKEPIIGKLLKRHIIKNVLKKSMIKL